ncbi:tripartite motif-containing protein 16-like protein isoform X2 [Brienomyrus brachyistius]|uniref:tripartite motif-containing protein 16-like protein isoform X2 n=1 Tax=Brienomyrus brachyistius TaxID=42636 RepID=UPI0020B1F25A|nr:tripartite motif-containing protein 16-like protein isoform X2 [Brienomyrus brachyistius]
MALSILTDQDQFKCLICLHLLEDPVTIPCRHSFCMDCIKRVWDWNDVTGIYNCPCCSKNFSPQPNLTIDVILNKKVEEIRRSRTRETLLSSSAGKKRKAPDSPALARSVHVFGIQKDMVCALHHRPLDVYCRTDQRSICSQCVTELHQPHETVSVVTERKMRQEQLAMERNRFQKKLQERERKLLETRMTLESFRVSAWEAEENAKSISAELIQTIEGRCSEVIEEIKNQEKAAVDEAKTLLQRMEQEIAEMRKRDSELEQISRTKNPVRILQRWPLPSLPAEPDDPPNLVVDLQLPLEMMKAALSDLKRQIGDMCDAEVMRISNTANDPSSTHGSSAAPERPSIPEQSDPEQSDREPSSRPEFLKYACHLTFDPNTANHELTLSADGQEVTRGDKEYYAIFPEKFVSKSQVLCREVLSGGRFYWEAELEGTKAEVAVTYRGISRKGTTSRASFGANDQSWSLDCINGVYSACYNMKRIDIRVPYSPRVGVYLDHKAGTLSFYSVSDTMTLLHRYQTTFHEPMCAGFWVGSGVTIKLCHLQQ